MKLRGSCIAIGLVLIASVVLAGPAAAKVGVYDEDSELARFEKAKCAVKGKKGKRFFVAFADGTGGWELDVYIYESFWGGVKDDYSLHYGVDEVGFDLFAPDGTVFSNRFPFPGTPPGAGGAIRFSKDGRRLGIGFYAAPNRDYSDGVALAGGLKCRYKRKHRP